MEAGLMLWGVLGLLSVFRLSYLATKEEGPFRLAERWRNLFQQDDWKGRGVRCLLCSSFWVSVFIAFLVMRAVWWGDEWAMFFLLWWGISGAYFLLHLKGW